MSKIISESSNLESAITPFIDAANTKYWKHALDILFINGAVLEQLQKRAPSLFYKSASSIFELITASLFKTIAEIRTAQLSCGIRENTYEDMINALSRLELIQPAVQVSICPKCVNYQLTLSQCPPSTTICPKCGEEWATQTVYLFKGQLSQIKAQNLDLPLFISSYLKFKIIPLTVLAEIEVYPNAIIETQTADKEKAEIDVYIPDLQAGIECKTYTDPTAPMTTQRLNGIVGDIMRKHIEKYLKANIENIFIVTNLPENHTQKLENALKNATEKQGIKLKTLTVIPGKIESLLQFLDEIAKDITNKISIFRES